MGSWNETDLLTQLPIQYKDKVRLLILSNQQYDVDSETNIHHGKIELEGGGMTSSDSIWSPVLPPLRGTYDDYGMIGNIKSGIEKNMTYDFFKKSFVFSDLKEVFRVEGYKENSKTQTLPVYLRSIERGNGSYTNRMNQTRTLGMAMILEDVYQAVMKYNPITMHHNQSNDEPRLYMPWQESLQLQIEGWYNDLLRSFKLIDAAFNEEEKVNALSLLFMANEKARFFDYRSACGKHFGSRFSESAKKSIDISDPSVQDLMKCCKETVILNSFMNATRKFYTPQCGKGSQGYELQPYLLLNKAVNEVAEKRKRIDEEESVQEVVGENGYDEYMLEHNEKELKRVKEINLSK